LSALIEFLMYASKSVRVFFVVHPRTRERLCSSGLTGKLEGRVRLSPPLGYLENLALMKGAKLVLTDSGGMQEETTFLGFHVSLCGAAPSAPSPFRAAPTPS
jgi:UDP-N-acetylglucosamine 2-epimerase (non-hydrolysing)